MTKLNDFLDAHDISSRRLSAASGYSAKHINELRKGIVSPTLRCVGRLVTACAELTDSPVAAEDLFDIPRSEVA